jgi:hypothetical protein
MKVKLSRLVKTALLVLAFAVGLLPIRMQAQATRQINSSGTTAPVTTPTGVPGVFDLEIDAALTGDDDGENDLGFDITSPTGVSVQGASHINRTIAVTEGQGHDEADHDRASSNPRIITSFDGLNFFDQRFANNGNQFSVEPPDQALCAGNGFVLEAWCVIAGCDRSEYFLRLPGGHQSRQRSQRPFHHRPHLSF